MATSINYIRKDLREVIAKISGTDGSNTISLATNMITDRDMLDGQTLEVNIRGGWFNVNASSSIDITRNGVSVLKFDASKIGTFNFMDLGFTDNTNNQYDVVVTIVGTAQLYLILSKSSGYRAI